MSRRSTATRTLAAAAAGYVIGMFPSAAIAARMATGGMVDLRAAGSGNPGGANAAKVLGAKWGYGVMAADITKAVVASAVGGAVAGPAGRHIGSVGSVAGHCYPATNSFDGGKGVATSVGQCLATFPAYFPIDVGVAAITVALPWWRERAFTATATASVVWVGCSALWAVKRWPNAWGPEIDFMAPLAAAASSGIIVERFSHGRRRVGA